MHIHFILLKCFTIVQIVSWLLSTVRYHCLGNGTVMIIATSICKVLSPPFRNALVTILLLLVRQAVHWSITCYILFSNLNTCTGRRISKIVVAYVVTLAKALIHPALITSTHVFIAILIIGWMIVHIIESSFGSATATTHDISIISWTVSVFLSFLWFEITLLSELAFVIECKIIWVLNIQFPLILWLFHSWFSVDWWERYLLVFWVESE